MCAPSIAMRRLLINRELHLNLILELNLNLGYIIINILQLFLQTVISRVGSKFVLDINLFFSQTYELEIESIPGCLDPLRMPCHYERMIGWLW